MTLPNLTQSADVALDPMAGTLQGTGRITYSPDFQSEQPATARVLQAHSPATPHESSSQPFGGRTRMQCQARGCDGCTVCLTDTFARAPGSHTLTLPYPISANRYWASRTVTPRGKPAFTSTYVTPEAKAYKAQVQKLALVAGVRKPIAGRVRVELTLYPNRPQDWQKRMRKAGASWDDSVQCLDLDNAQKVVLDSLKDVAFQDDAWVREISARRAEPDEFGARLVAIITSLPTEQPQTDLFAPEARIQIGES